MVLTRLAHRPGDPGRRHPTARPGKTTREIRRCLKRAIARPLLEPLGLRVAKAEAQRLEVLTRAARLGGLLAEAT